VESCPPVNLKKAKIRIFSMAKHRRKHWETYLHGHLGHDSCFAALVAAASLGVLSLTYLLQGIYMHVNTIATLMTFIFVGVLWVKYAHGFGQSQAFYSAALAAFGYFAFYRVYNYMTFNDAWRTSPIVGDSLVNAVINTVIVYGVYLLFIYAHKK